MLKDFSVPDNVCLVVEDQALIRASLMTTIAKVFPGLSIHAVGTIIEAKRWIDSRSTEAKKAPLVFSLIDLGLPDGSGVDLVRYLSEKEPCSKNVVVTIFTEDRYLFDALAAGAFGYILKCSGEDLMIQCLRRMQDDEPPLSPSIARRLLSHFRSPTLTDAKRVALTPRETQTLTLLVRGFTIPESAVQLGLSAQTLTGYVKSIYQKLHVSNRAEATREAIRHGIV